MKAFNTLLKSELKLSIRDMNIPIFGIGLPLIVAVIIGLINGNQPAFEGAHYSFIDQSFGAFAAIGICATGLMGMPLIVADYRHKKILKHYMVTPVSPTILLFVQFIINMIMAVISLVLLFIICSVFWDYKMIGNAGWFLLSYFLVILSIYSIGLMLASVAPNIKSANLLCTLVYFPMLFFSGATIPYEIMPRSAQMVMDVLPLTQGIKLLKGVSLGQPVENILLSIAILSVITLVCTTLSIKFFKWE